jgi:outer membrane protein OmpA-like peptidoglycan-associated protein
MNENPTYNLEVLGHTDDQGDDANNMKLSKDRAAAVEKYLEDKGVNTGRVRSEGFGETMPVADNKTSAGRAKNRRVEFKVSFME